MDDEAKRKLRESLSKQIGQHHPFLGSGVFKDVCPYCGWQAPKKN